MGLKLDKIYLCNIFDSLKPLNPSNVINVETNVGRHEAIVTVNSVVAKQKALGYGNQNLKYAMELINWKISINLFPENSKLSNNKKDIINNTEFKE